MADRDDYMVWDEDDMKLDPPLKEIPKKEPEKEKKPDKKDDDDK